MSAKILVTGASGTIGAHLVRALAAKGNDVRAALHSPRHIDRVKGPHVEPVVMELEKPESIAAALKDIDRVFLLTPFVENLSELSARVVDLAGKAGVRYIVKLSAAGAESEAILAAKWQRAAERHLEGSGISYSILRPTFFAQNFLTYHRSTIVSEGTIYMPVGDSKTSYIDARDIAAVAATVLTGPGHEGKTYTLTGPAAVSVADVASFFTEALGKSVLHVDISPDAAAQAMKNTGAPDLMITAMGELSTVMKMGYTAGVTNATKEITGEKPISVEQFVRDHVAEFR